MNLRHGPWPGTTSSDPQGGRKDDLEHGSGRAGDHGLLTAWAVALGSAATLAIQWVLGLEALR